jgi:hypothetical protein
MKLMERMLTALSVGPKLNGIWATLKRTHRLEGWYGLYKGMLTVVSCFISLKW